MLLYVKEIRHKRSHIIWLYRIGKSIEKEYQLVIVRDWEEDEMGSDDVKGTVSSFGMMKRFWN